MNTDNTKSQMRKGMLEYCIMLLLPRKYYVLTAEGQQALALLDAGWEEIQRTVSILKIMD